MTSLTHIQVMTAVMTTQLQRWDIVFVVTVVLWVTYGMQNSFEEKCAHRKRKRAWALIF